MGQPRMAARPGLRSTRLHSAPASADDEADGFGHRNAPLPEAACLYGLVGEVARAGGEDAETHAHAIAANEERGYMMPLLGLPIARRAVMAGAGASALIAMLLAIVTIIASAMQGLARLVPRK